MENTISRTGLGIVKLQGIYKWLREDTDSVLFEGIQSQLSSLCEQWKDILGFSKSFVECIFQTANCTEFNSRVHNWVVEKEIWVQLEWVISEIHALIVDEVIETTGYDMCIDSALPLLQNSLTYIGEFGDLRRQNLDHDDEHRQKYI